MNYFTYNNGTDITNGAFRISASQLSRFFDDTSNWYREFLLGEAGFQGSVNTYLGTTVHAAAAMYIDTKQIDYEQIADFIESTPLNFTDQQIITTQHVPMIDALQTNFLSKTRFHDSERFLWHEILPGIGVGGSCDARSGSTVIDFKTTSSKTPPTKFSRSYWFQLMTYAWLYKQQGIDIKQIKLVYVTQQDINRVSEVTGKPMKDYPSTVSEVVDYVTDDSLAIIEGCIRLIADSVHFWNNNPDLRYLLAQDNRLKLPPKPILFKD